MTKQELDKRIHDTYYSKKNKELLPSFIVTSIILIIFKHAIILEIALWAIYAMIWAKNNEKLQNDPMVKKEREFLLENYDRLLKEE